MLTGYTVQPLFGRLCEWPSFEPVNDTVRGGKSTSSWRVDPRTNIGSFTGLLGEPRNVLIALYQSRD